MYELKNELVRQDIERQNKAVDELKKSKKMCVGCEDNFYNGNNQYGVKECWSFESAEIVEKLEVASSQCPPYDKSRARPVLSCFHRKQYVQVKPSSLTEDGCWKS